MKKLFLICLLFTCNLLFADETYKRMIETFLEKGTYITICYEDSTYNIYPKANIMSFYCYADDRGSGFSFTLNDSENVRCEHISNDIEGFIVNEIKLENNNIVVINHKQELEKLVEKL